MNIEPQKTGESRASYLARLYAADPAHAAYAADITGKAPRSPKSTEVSVQERCRIAGEIAGGVIWRSQSWGTCTCPEGHEIRVYVDDNPKPTFFCFHDGCRQPNSQLAEWNKRLRERCGDPIKRPLTAPEKEERNWLRRLHDLHNSVQRYSLPALLKLPPVPLDHWLSTSPVDVADLDGMSQFRAYLSGLFSDEPIMHLVPKVWCGEPRDTGDEIFAACFRTVSDWLKTKVHPGPQVCLSQFRPRTMSGKPVYARTKINVISRQYFVLEGDKTSKEQFGNVINFARESLGLTLRSITDSGNKSIHAVFDQPAPPAPRYGPDSKEAQEEAKLEVEYKAAYEKAGHWNKEATAKADAWRESFWRLRVLQERDKLRCDRAEEEVLWQLRGLGCDSAMWSTVGCSRLPGCERKDENGNVIGFQRLLYLDPRYPIL